jgi:hypothetical protein
MDQRAEERVVLPVDRATQRGAEAGYRRQVERIFNPISLSALPERDPGLSKLPVDRLFISLALELRPAISILGSPSKVHPKSSNLPENRESWPDPPHSRDLHRNC